MPELSKEASEELSRLKEKLENCEEKLKDLERLKKVEQSIMVGLKEEGFSDKALDLFRYRKNFLIEGDPLENNADVVAGFTGACGDHVDTYLRINKEKGIIEDAKYKTDGCPGAVTSASAVTELAKAKRLEEALKLNAADVVRYLEDGTGSLPKHMRDCCAIAVGSLREAIRKYKERTRERERRYTEE